MNVKAVTTGVALLCAMFSPIVVAAEGIEGTWEFKSRMPEWKSEATMTIVKGDDGKLTGTWSSQFGEGTLSDIAFDKGELKFILTNDFGGQEMKTSYEVKVDGTKFNGKGKNQFGESSVEGQLQGEAKGGTEVIAGTWDINITVPAREITDKLVITKNADGTLAGKWTAQRGENTISNIKFEAGKLTFTRSGKIGPMEFTSTYEGTVEGDSLKGVFHSDFGDREANAMRISSAESKAEPNKPEPNKPK